MSFGTVFFAHKKHTTARNSQLTAEASKNSISNDCQAKTERRSELAGVPSVSRDRNTLETLFYGQPWYIPT